MTEFELDLLKKQLKSVEERFNNLETLTTNFELEDYEFRKKYYKLMLGKCSWAAAFILFCLKNMKQDIQEKNLEFIETVETNMNLFRSYADLKDYKEFYEYKGNSRCIAAYNEIKGIYDALNIFCFNEIIEPIMNSHEIEGLQIQSL